VPVDPARQLIKQPLTVLAEGLTTADDNDDALEMASVDPATMLGLPVAKVVAGAWVGDWSGGGRFIEPVTLFGVVAAGVEIGPLD